MSTERPAMLARYSGTIGTTQGVANDMMPSPNAMGIVLTLIRYAFHPAFDLLANNDSTSLPNLSLYAAERSHGPSQPPGTLVMGLML